MSAPRKKQRDRTSALISAGMHAALLGGLAYWVIKTETGQQVARSILQAVLNDKKKDAPPPPKVAAPPPPASQGPLPPINTGPAPPTTRPTTARFSSSIP